MEASLRPARGPDTGPPRHSRPARGSPLDLMPPQLRLCSGDLTSCEMNFDDILFECLERIEEEGEQALHSVCARHPDHANAIRERMAMLISTGLVELPDPVDAQGLPERLGEFRILRKLGEGGMGMVLLAEQEAMNRTVALKLLRPSEVYFSRARDRFQREVEAIARLSHPAIAMVHTVGEEHGVPYFSMERVHGLSLDAVIRSLSSKEPAELAASDMADVLSVLPAEEGAPELDRGAALFGTTWERACLSMVREIAVALAHAHEQGVLHRDLKPSNVMLTPNGTVKLLDFGLATTSEGGRMTRTGQVVGSWPYMAPELLDGGDPTEATDVYGLGVLLYELLTLALPFGSTTSLPVLQRAILDGRPPALRALNRAISWDTETVCLKAMSRDPAHRYPGASEVARDLDNVLAHRTIEARRVALPRRVLRWVQRNRSLTAALVLAVVGTGTVIVMQSQHADRVEYERDLARSNLESATDAIVVMVEEVLRRDLSNTPGMDPIRVGHLERSRHLFQQLVDGIEDPSAVPDQWTRLHRYLGRVLLALDRQRESLPVLGVAREGLRAQLTSQPSSEARWDLLAVLGWLAQAHDLLGNEQKSQQLLKEADSLIGDLSLEGSPGRIADFLTIRRNLVGALAGQGPPEEALDRFASTQPLVAEIERGDVQPAVQVAAAMLLHSAAVAQRALGEEELASSSLERCMDLFDGILELPGADLDWRIDFGEACLTRAGQDLDLQGPTRTLERLVPALKRFDPSAEGFPDSPRLVRAAASLNEIHGRCLFITGRVEEAEPCFQRALDLLAGTRSTQTSYLESSASVRNNVASFHLALGQLEEARRAIEQGLADRRTWKEVSGADVNLVPMDTVLFTACEIALQREDWREALRLAREVLDRAGEEPVVAIVLCEVYSRASELARNDASKEAEQRADDLLDQSLGFLEMALQGGYRNLERIRKEPDLRGIRNHPDFEFVLGGF